MNSPVSTIRVPRWTPLVLVVDDSPTHVAVVRNALETAGYRVEVAATGRQALDLARQLGPDLVLMDIVMPDMNGFQATRKLARNPVTAEIPVILASSKSGATDRVWGLRQGAVEYLVKPLEAKRMLAAVRHAIDRATQVAEQRANARD